MIISHSKEFIFVKTKKVGGSSTGMWLQQFLTKKDEVYSKVKKGSGKKLYNHAPVSLLLTLDPHLFQNYYTFTILRHPFNRMISEYYYSWSGSFESFLVSGHAQGTCNEPLVTWNGRLASFNKTIFYERSIEDLKEIASNLNLPVPAKENFPQRMTQFRQDRSSWREFMTSEHVKIAKKRFPKEIEFHRQMGYDV